MNKNPKKNNKFILLTVLLLLLSVTIFFYYRLFIEISYSTDYDTTGIVTKMEFEDDSQNLDKWSLEIEYKDSKEKKVIDTYIIYEKSDDYKELEVHNVKVGSKINIRTEEGFSRGFLGKRFLYSSVVDILEY